MSTCARCKTYPAVIGSRCMKCRIRECADEGLVRHPWWVEIEPRFIACMIGRYMNDGRGGEPPTADEVVRSLKIRTRANKAALLQDIYALVEMVDRARRKKNADPVRGQEG